MKNHVESNAAAASAAKKALVHKHVVAAFGVMTVFGTTLAVILSCADNGEPHPRGVTFDGDAGTRSDAGGFTRIDEDLPCADEGRKVDCHEVIGTNGGVVTCLSGERTCTDGVWGPCVGKFSARSGSPRDTLAVLDPNDVHILALSDAGSCQDNPCDPYCFDYEEDPPGDGGYEVVPTVETVYYTGSLEDAIALNPPGFINKGMKTPCDPANVQECQFDSHCVPTGTHGQACPNGAAYCCMAWNSLEYDTTCAKPDVTTGFACTKDGLPTIPVCNRGSVTLPADTRVYVFPGNAPQFPDCDPNDRPKSECLVGVPVPPGTCVNINNCNPQFGGNGTRTIFVNPPKTSMNGGKNNPKWKDECTCKNNWGVWSGDSAICYEKPNYNASPVTKTQTYEAACPPGTHAQWQYLTWNTTTPLDSNVLWKGRVALTPDRLAATTYVSLGTAKAIPTPDTHICSMTSPAGCPINLFTVFGGSPNANSPFLELEITINPSTDKTQGATVNGWQVSYSCPPSE